MNTRPKSFDEWFNAATTRLNRKTRQRLELELSIHYEDSFQESIDLGVPPDEAARRALKKLGDSSAAREMFCDEFAKEIPLLVAAPPNDRS